MCLGSYVLPRYIGVRHHPLKVYAVLELGIGLMGLLLLWGMPLVNSLYSAIGGGNMFQANQTYMQFLNAAGGDASWLAGKTNSR